MTSKCVKRFLSVINLRWVCLWGLTPWIVTESLVRLMYDLKPCSPTTLQTGDSSALMVVMPDQMFLLRFLSCFVEVIPHAHALGSLRALSKMVGTTRLLGNSGRCPFILPLGTQLPWCCDFYGMGSSCPPSSPWCFLERSVKGKNSQPEPSSWDPANLLKHHHENET